jgi:hypothetical protein
MQVVSLTSQHVSEDTQIRVAANPVRAVAVLCEISQRNIQPRSRNHCCRGKEISITNSERDLRSLYLVVRQAERVLFLPVACQNVQHFYSYRTQNVCFHFLCDFRPKYSPFS